MKVVEQGKYAVNTWDFKEMRYYSTRSGITYICSLLFAHNKLCFLRDNGLIFACKATIQTKYKKYVKRSSSAKTREDTCESNDKTDKCDEVPG